MMNKSTFNGTLFESEFVVEALRRGFVTHLPITPMPWDFVVECPAGLLKVQIKGTMMKAEEDGSYKMMICRIEGGKKVAIGELVDVIACWVDEARVWYIMPPEEQTAKCIRLYAKNKMTKSKNEQYRDNWSIFYNSQS